MLRVRRGKNGTTFDGACSSFSSSRSISRHPEMIFRRRIWRLGVSTAESTMTGPCVIIFSRSLTCVNNRACPAILLPTITPDPICNAPARINALDIVWNVSSRSGGDLTNSERSFVIFSLNVARIPWISQGLGDFEYLDYTILLWPKLNERFSSEFPGGIWFLSVEKFGKVQRMRRGSSFTAFSFAGYPEWGLNWLILWC